MSPFQGRLICQRYPCKGRHFQHDMILQRMRWYLAYALRYRDIETMMAERGFCIDHSTINRWVLHYSPQLGIRLQAKEEAHGSSVENG
jgi:transposase-like protein